MTRVLEGAPHVTITVISCDTKPWSRARGLGWGLDHDVETLVTRDLYDVTSLI